MTVDPKRDKKEPERSLSEEYAWCNPARQGLRVADTLDEVKNFAYAAFDRLDENGDGFISKEELSKALEQSVWDWRDRSYIVFLLRRAEDIQSAYDEEWRKDSDSPGISRADIQEYFKLIRSKVAGG